MKPRISQCILVGPLCIILCGRSAPLIEQIVSLVAQMEDEYGSPSLEDITSFSRAMSSGLDEALGEEEAGTIEVEVSSPVSPLGPSNMIAPWPVVLLMPFATDLHRICQICA